MFSVAVHMKYKVLDVMKYIHCSNEWRLLVFHCTLINSLELGDPIWCIELDQQDSKVHGANMGPIWGHQDPGGPHVGTHEICYLGGSGNYFLHQITTWTNLAHDHWAWIQWHLPEINFIWKKKISITNTFEITITYIKGASELLYFDHN